MSFADEDSHDCAAIEEELAYTRHQLAQAKRLKALVTKLKAGLEAADRILWMAEAYADSGGSGGPEMRDYAEAAEEIRAAMLAARAPGGEGDDHG